MKSFAQKHVPLQEDLLIVEYKFEFVAYLLNICEIMVINDQCFLFDFEHLTGIQIKKLANLA